MIKRIIKLLVSLMYLLIERCGRFLLRTLGRQERPRLVILYYHGVPVEFQDRFAWQLDAISRYGDVVPAQFTNPLATRRSAVAITFDDAFVSVGEIAVPELARRHMHATIFVPSAVLGELAEWEMAEKALSQQEEVMSAAQLRVLDADLVALGSHTATHARLTEIDDRQLRSELEDSKRQLEQVFDRPVTTLSFPFGAHDDRVVKACRDAGYERVFSIRPAMVDLAGAEYVRGRVSVEPSDWPLEFHLKLRGAYAWMTLASSLKRRLRPLPAPTLGKTRSQVDQGMLR